MKSRKIIEGAGTDNDLWMPIKPILSLEIRWQWWDTTKNSFGKCVHVHVLPSTVFKVSRSSSFRHFLPFLKKNFKKFLRITEEITEQDLIVP